MRRIAAVIALVVLAGCGGEDVLGPTKDGPPSPAPSASPTPAPQQVLRLALSARQGGNIIREVDYDEFFVIEAGPVCVDPDQTCPRPSVMQWRASGAYCEFFSDITAPQVVAVCIGGGIARFTAYSPEFDVSGELQIKVNVP